VRVDVDDLQDRLDRCLAAGLPPGAQLAVAQGDELLEVAGGVLHRGTGQPTTTTSVFQIGSVTKAWVATAVVQLADEGDIDLDRPVRTWLPDLALRPEETAARVTPRHLLAHTSGIVGDVFTDTGRGDDALRRYVAALADLPPAHALGETWSYCNAGYCILGLLLEERCGTTVEAVIRDRVAAPLEIDRLAWDGDEAILLGAAVGHLTDLQDGTARVTPTFAIPRSNRPAGGLMVSAGDLARFGRAHLRDGAAPGGQRILSAAGARAMRTRQAVLPTRRAAGWGLGWTEHDLGGRAAWGHGGATLGQMAELLLLPEDDVVIALLVNGMRGRADHALLEGLLRDLVGVGLPPIPTPPAEPVEADLARYVGRYVRHGTESEVTLAPDGGLEVRTRSAGHIAEVLGTEDLPAVPLIPVTADGTFLAPWPGGLDLHQEVRFCGGDPAAPRFLHSSGRAAARVEPTPERSS
jgi:CubicO group peptidase (beta-lactamase class C family)